MSGSKEALGSSAGAQTGAASAAEHPQQGQDTKLPQRGRV